MHPACHDPLERDDEDDAPEVDDVTDIDELAAVPVEEDDVAVLSPLVGVVFEAPSVPPAGFSPVFAPVVSGVPAFCGSLSLLE